MNPTPEIGSFFGREMGGSRDTFREKSRLVKWLDVDDGWIGRFDEIDGAKLEAIG